MYRKIIFITVLVLILFFIVGYFAANGEWINGFNSDLYFRITTIVGGIASVFGLLGLAYTKSQVKSIEEIESDYLRKFIDLKEAYEKSEQAALSKSREIENLEAKRKILEISIERASKAMFAKAKKEGIEKEINTIILDNKKLKELLNELEIQERELVKLGELIETDKNVDIINEILKNNSLSNAPFSIRLGESIGKFLHAVYGI